MATFDQYLNQLHPDVRPLAAAFLQEAAAAGLDPRVQEAFRSKDRQDQLYAQGRTAPGAVVTKARGGQSNHNYGVAFDVVPGALLGAKNWDPENPAWAKLGEIGKKHGLEWGGDWKFTDRPHFQMAGANWRQLQNDPKFMHFNGDGHNHGETVANAAPAQNTPMPLAPKPEQMSSFQPMTQPSQFATPEASVAPKENTPLRDENSALSNLFATLAPSADAMGGAGGVTTPVATGGGDVSATQNAFLGAQNAGQLAAGLAPDIEALLAMGKRAPRMA